MKIAIHQPNFIPWFPFFYKMQHSDVFVLMINCQFEKNGYQNRAEVFGDWWTLPVKSGTCTIREKKYLNGHSVDQINVNWILSIAMTLGIDTSKIHMDFPSEKTGTDRIIEICRYYKCDEYLANPEATEKYLDEQLLNSNGIELVPIDTPHKKHIFEMFKECGIDGTIKLLNRPFKKKEIEEGK